MFISLSPEARGKAGGEDFVSAHNLDTPNMEWWRVTANEVKVCRPFEEDVTPTDRRGLWRYLHEGTWVQLTPRQVREKFPEIWQRLVDEVGVTIADMPHGQKDAW